MSRHWFRPVVRLLAAISIVLVAGSTSAQLRPEQDAVNLAPRELIDRLRADPIAYFRFANKSWTARVCDMFADEIRGAPIVRLHGDAHVEQFTVTTQAWGLDDFDHSVEGPALVDIVRFLGSIDLVARQRGWIVERDSLFDRFFSGYRKGLRQPEFRPPRPLVVDRLRVGMQRSRPEFLNWGETLMEPMADGPMKAVAGGMEAIARVVYAERPISHQATSRYWPPDGFGWEWAAPRRRRFSSAFREHRQHRMMMSSLKPNRFKASKACGAYSFRSRPKNRIA
jgi:hypothetical protein